MITQEKLEVWTKNWIAKQGNPTKFELKRLVGDGSTRSFYRLFSGENSFIVLHDPEWTLSQDYPAHQNFLKTSSLPVPQFFEIDKSAGVLVMEDLGDELLQFRILKHPKDKMSWLRSATQLLADLHGKTFPVPKTLPVSTRSFDEKKYFDELNFTLEHLHQKFLGLAPLETSKKEKLKTFCAKIGNFGPSVFCHRDYHTRNLLLHRETLVMIDFQDARLGSPQYDLASILYDAYVPVTQAERAELLALYRSQLANYPLNREIDWRNFETHLSWVAYQRTIKAAGSFASFYTRFGKDTHLSYLVPALESAFQLQNSCEELKHSVESIFDLPHWIKLAKTQKHGQSAKN